MKKVLWLIACLMTMVTFTSCSSDDDEIVEDEYTYTSIVGKWEVTHAEGIFDLHIDGEVIKDLKFNMYYDDNHVYTSHIEKELEEIFHCRMMFNGVGNVTIMNSYSCEYCWDSSNTFHYYINGNRLTICNENINNVYTILKLTHDTLILELKLEDSYRGRLSGEDLSHYAIYTFTKTDW